MSRDPSALSTQLFDVICVAVLGLLLAVLGGAVARAMPTEAETGAPAAAAAGKSDADCDQPGKPDKPATATAPAMAGGLPASMSIGTCAGEEGTNAPAAPAPPPHQ